MNQLVALGAHTVVLAYQVIGWVVVVVIVQALAPLLHWLTGKQRLERCSRHVLRLLQTSQVEEGRCEVDVLNHLVAFALWLDVLRIADDEWSVE